MSGLYLAVSSPSLPVIVSQETEKLSEGKLKVAKEQSKIELFEIGTGSLALSLDMRMPIKHFAWSHCGRYISCCGLGPTSSTRLSVLPHNIQDQIYSMIDALRYDKHFWYRFNVDLTQVNVEPAKPSEQVPEVNKNTQTFVRPPQKHGLAMNRILPVEVSKEFSRIEVKSGDTTMLGKSLIFSDPVDIDLDVE